MKLSVVCSLLAAFCFHGVMTQTPDRSPSQRYPHVMNMDHEGDYILKWGFDERDIWFQVQARTLGYVGFGISENGLMVPADVVVGYIANGRVIFTDFHTDAYSSPVLDASQDWRIDHGYEENGWTTLGFNRSLDTCDTVGDRVITKDTMQLIYSYDAQDPTDPLSLFHHDSRGSKPVSLLTTAPPPSFLPAESYTRDFQNNNYTIPADNPTTFHCRVFDLSDMMTKYHVIKAEPVISPETEINVHHMTLYRCRVQDTSLLLSRGDSFNCFTDAPDTVEFCREHVASFGHGADELYFPADVGVPIGGSNEANVYVLATHYDNSDYVPGLIDNSGIKLTFTATLRPNEAGYLSMGNIISPNWLQFIPPGEEAFVQKAFCSRRCLHWGARRSVRQSNMTVVGVQYHAHSLGKAMKLRHTTYIARDTVVENPPIVPDEKFDSHSQNLRIAANRPQIAAYDQLSLECTYNSMERGRPTVGGWTEYDEVCRAYVLYYPRREIEGCMSWSNYDELRDPQGQRVNGRDVFGLLVATDWTQAPAMRQNLRHALDTSIENAQCWSSRQTPSYAIDYFRQPQNAQPFVEPPSQSCRQPSG